MGEQRSPPRRRTCRAADGRSDDDPSAGHICPGTGPALVFFAGALADHDLWRDVIAPLEHRYRCITVDLPLGADPWPLSDRADRSAASLARPLLECLELLDLQDATVIANDTAGGLLLLSLASDHPALARIARPVLTNCESYDQFARQAADRVRDGSQAPAALPRTTSPPAPLG